MYALILAGGTGTRLWPVSRQNSPKQTQVFFDNQTLLQKTHQRLLKVFAPAEIYISTVKSLAPVIKKQLPGFPKSHILVEPQVKNTAAAIAFAAWQLHKKDPQAIMITINSDHFIKDEAEFAKVIALGQKAIKKYPRQTVLIGIKANYPETGYGYIKLGPALTKNLYKVAKFVEKPKADLAKRYVDSGEYLWNPAYFIWRVDYLLELIDKHLPEISAMLKKMDAVYGKKNYERVLQEEFKKLPNLSIDYGLMEKLTDLLVIPAEFGWADIGHWRAVRDILAVAERENVVRGQHIGHDSHGNLIYSQSGKLVATIGVNDLIVVEADDVILVCPKDRAQEVKKIVEDLKANGHSKYL